MAIDNETREPTGFAIFDDRTVVRPGAKPEDERVIVVRDHATLDREPGPFACDRTVHGRTEYLGRVMVQGGVDAVTRQPLGVRFLLFPIPAVSLYTAFQFLDDEQAVRAAVDAAVKADTEQRQQAAVANAVRSGLILSAGK